MSVRNRIPGRVVIPADRIASRIAEMGRDISADYAGEGLTAVVVLSGAFVFAADLVRALAPDIGVHVVFVRASSYLDRTESSGSIAVELGNADFEERNVLIVEDIVDTGRTIRVVTDSIARRSPATLRTAALLRKSSAPVAADSIDYLGFTIPDEFVVGYGLDFAGSYRELPDVRVLAGTDT